MKKLAEMLKEYVERNPFDYGEVESTLDILFWYYVEYSGADSEKIRSRFDSLRNLVNFSPKEYDQVFDVVSDLCLEHGRLAFREGIRFGVQLMNGIGNE